MKTPTFLPLPILIVFALLSSTFQLTSTVALGVIDEQTARSLFSQALVELYNGRYRESYELSLKSMTGRIFMQELAFFWYLRGRLAILNGEIDKAVEDLLNFTFLVRNDDIDNLLNKVNYFRRINLLPSNRFELTYVTTLSGRVQGIDYFQSPISLAVFGNELHVLDARNRRLVSFQNNRISRVRRLSRDYKQVFVSRSGKVYLATNNGIFDSLEREVLGDLRVAVVAGISRTNEVYIVDVDRVVVLNLGSRQQRTFPVGTRIVCLDAEIDGDSLYILDGLYQRVIVYELGTMKVRGEPIKTPGNIWNFEVTPFGDILFLSKDGVVIGESEFELKNVNFIEYSYPLLFAVKWQSAVIDVYSLKDDKPIFVSIDRMLFDDNNAYAYVRVENLLGDDLHFVQNILTIAEQDVYTPSETGVEVVEVPTLNLRSCEPELAYYRFRGVRVSGACNILNKLTGSAPGLSRTHRLYWVARWRYARPVPDGIIKVSARVSFKSGTFYDAMFYTNQLLSVLRKEGS